MSHGKAARYVAQLYDARNNCQWQAVTELARKVEKHAPLRKCLYLSARFNAELCLDPGKFSQSTKATHYLQALDDACTIDKTLARENFEAQVCRAVLLANLGQTHEALKALDTHSELLQPPNSPSANTDPWDYIVTLRGNSIKASILQTLGDSQGAENLYESLLPAISHLTAQKINSKELDRCIEDFVWAAIQKFAATAKQHPASRAAMNRGFRIISSGSRIGLPSTALRQFYRLQFESLTRNVVEGKVVTENALITRNHLDLLSRRKLSREQFEEITRVEGQYEKLLLQYTDFPKANESNMEVKNLVELVMSNWRIFCGSTWDDSDLGPGGKVGVGRRTLETLYALASKSFHSTQILRSLFNVHVYLGEFTLAFKAFDSYNELISKGKARMEKSGHKNSELDDDNTVILLAVDAVRVACRCRPTATATSKAADIAASIQRWLHKGNTIASNRSVNDGGHDEACIPVENHRQLTPFAISAAQHAIGISYAQSSRYTHDSSRRQKLQEMALEAIRKSLAFGDKSFDVVESLYVLALLLGETRNIPEAIEAAKRAIMVESREDGITSDRKAYKDHQESFLRHTRALPVWHLLSLLLTARDDFALAEQTCEAALFQLASDEALFSQADIRSSFDEYLPTRSSTDNPNSRDEDRTPKLSSQNMSPLEKQYLLDIRLTQISLLEVEDGPEVAVNTAFDLLSLYARLYGTTANIDDAPPNTGQSTPVAGTSAVNEMQDTTGGGKQVMQQKQISSDHLSKAEISLKGPSNERFQGARYPNSSTNSAGSAAQPTIGIQSTYLKKTASAKLRKHRENIGGPLTASSGNDNKRVIRSANDKSKNIPSRENMSYSNDINHQQDTDNKEQVIFSTGARTITCLTPLLGGIRSSIFNTSELVKIWLFISRLYCRASMLEDAFEAVEEAKKLVAELESKVQPWIHASTNIQCFEFGRLQSIPELWADVHYQHGALLQATTYDHDALTSYEKALSHHPDHLNATIALSMILLDIYGEKVAPEKQKASLDSLALEKDRTHMNSVTERQSGSSNALTRIDNGELSPPQLNRIAARDRACGLLTSITKLGNAWDSSEAWATLARAYEASGQIEKAREAWWWTVEMEESKPLRHWRHVNAGGYVL